ncbi:alpha/beta hydrolase [Pseudorhizobium endolithicum]|uniref:Alpha/beta hydrolase n=1 Tax=Pseudorhizobium endolithicum TaxID=1191678 RepID=A0ABN7JVZ2_9HYPH|nr:alpha/beta fold hydrolase [Pseudorhizobium endolithicum]CAD6414319.1 alpha/beta hydrolase [Rhizobium sp. Q54]CAD7045293.1 alpha/beta hydrolase [Pseudorhizobium endolithicum]
MPPIAIKAIRPLFSIGGRLAPRATARLAFQLFCLTPARKPAGAKAHKVHSEGSRRLAAAQTMPFRVGKARVMAYLLQGAGAAPRKRMLVVHGWGSAAAYISGLAEGLAAGGADVVVLDLPGHGRSTGRHLNMRMAVEAIVEAERHFGPFDGAVGHSFGGASLLLAAGGIMPAAGRISPQRMAVIGSPTRIEWLFDGFSQMLGLNQSVRTSLIEHAESVAGAPLSQFDAIPIAERIRTPLLVVHAEEDKEVDAAHARRYASVPSARIHWANGHGHRRIIAAPEVIDTVVGFLVMDDKGDRRSTAA